MSLEAVLTRNEQVDRDRDRDRELIRIDFAHDKLGIAAALRQAFAAAAHDHSQHDFDKLLSELH